MSQILAIFRKDARHFWVEILISLALQTALVLTFPHTWRYPGLTGTVSYSPVGFFTHTGPAGGLLVVLIPISWWILLARLIHEERLVGDTQFWVTRPYQWQLLLSAKLLFAAVFVYFPSLIAQSILLHAAGFHPLSHIPGLLFNGFLIGTVLILPKIVLATLTSNLARMALAILGFMLYVVGLSTLGSLVPKLASSPSLVSGPIGYAVLICSACAIILIQYARRRARTAWLLLAAVALLLGPTALFDPDQPFMNRYYPPATTSTPPVQITYGANAMYQPVTHGTAHKGIVEVAVPVHITGVPAGSVFVPVALKVTFNGTGASHWDSPWQTTTPEKLLPGASDTVFRFRMPRQTYDQFRTGPLALHITFAVDQARAVRSATIALPGSRFEVPGFALCTPTTGWDREPVTIGIGCLSALHQPDLTLITVPWHDSCRAQDPGSQQTIPGFGWAGVLDPPPATLSLTSVWEAPTNLTNSWRYTDNHEQGIHMRQICPGSPVTFTTYALETRTRVEFSIPDFRLPEFSKASTAGFETQ